MQRQCDGCTEGYPVKDGLHYLNDRAIERHRPFMACTAQHDLTILCPRGDGCRITWTGQSWFHSCTEHRE